MACSYIALLVIVLWIHPYVLASLCVIVMLPACMQELAANGHLDISQSDALRRALLQRVALIQGPPGTGKTYVSQQWVNGTASAKDLDDQGGRQCHRGGPVEL